MRRPNLHSPISKLLTILTLAAVSALASPAQQQAPAGKLISTRALALNAQTGKLYAVESDTASVAVYDPHKNSTTEIKVGAEPIALAINSSTNRVYVVNHTAGTISVIDGSTDTVIATIDVGAEPYVVAVNPATNQAYVSNTFSSDFTVIDGATNKTSKVKAGSADSIVVDSKRGDIYLAGYQSTKLDKLSAATPAAVAANGAVTIGIHGWGIALDESKSEVYVTRSGNSELAIVDEASGKVTFVPTGKIPSAVAFNPATSRLYVVNHGDDTVTVIDAAARKPLATIPVGVQPQAVVVDAKSNRIYVANTHGDTITVIDGATNAATQTLHTGKNPYALAFDPDNNTLYVALYGEPALQVLHTDGAATK
jgi:YVTN family beta-propeller protein